MRKSAILLGAALLLGACNEDKRNDRHYDHDRQTTRTERHRDHDNRSTDRDDARRYDDDGRRDDDRRSDERRSDAEDRDRNNDERLARTNAGTSTAADTAFLKDAAMANLTEVELGEMALNKSQNEDVRRYAQRMVTDHRQNQSKLEALARKLAVNLPTELDSTHQAMVDRHAALSGTDFDRAYIDMMTQDHQMVVNKFEHQSQEASNEQVRNYASSTLPTLRDHLRDAQNIDERLASRQ